MVREEIPIHLYADVDLRSGVGMTLRDGTRLVADVYTPVGEGPFPVLLMRQPYGRDIASTVVYAPPAWFARRGYIVVIQDVRGRGGSDGRFYAFADEAGDGAESVEWAAGLPKSNGKVGMYGFSYQGYTQLAAASSRPGPLRALAPHMTAFDLYSGWFYRDGMLQLATTLGWGNQMLRQDAARAGAGRAYLELEAAWARPGSLARELPVRGVPPLHAPELPTYVADWIAHDSPDSYWDRLDMQREDRLPDLPMFHLGGFYDFYLRGTLGGYRAARDKAPDRQFLVLGPWVHIPWADRGHAGPPFGAGARLPTDLLLARWFDRWLKDDASAAEETSGATYYLLGADTWRRAPAWPPPEAESETWFLRSGGGANSRFGDGELSREGASGPPDTFNYDPEVPVLAPGGQMNGAQAWGPVDLAPAQNGNNILVYTAPPHEKEWVLCGRPRCRLYLRSTAEATAFVARLSVVDTQGRAHFLTLGAARWFADRDQPLVIELDDTACLLRPGERLRLDLSSSAFPLLIRHPNRPLSPAEVSSPAGFHRALQVIEHDPAAPSALLLPFLP